MATKPPTSKWMVYRCKKPGNCRTTLDLRDATNSLRLKLCYCNWGIFRLNCRIEKKKTYQQIVGFTALINQWWCNQKFWELTSRNRMQQTKHGNKPVDIQMETLPSKIRREVKLTNSWIQQPKTGCSWFHQQARSQLHVQVRGLFTCGHFNRVFEWNVLKPHLVGGLNPSEKYQVLVSWDDYSQYMGK